MTRGTYNALRDIADTLMEVSVALWNGDKALIPLALADLADKIENAIENDEVTIYENTNSVQNDKR